MSRSFDLLDRHRAPRGVATLLKTPFKSENRLDEASYRRQVRHVIDAGTVLLIPGMIGSETYCLPPEDRERCIQISLEESNGRVPVCAAVCGIGVYDVARSAARAQEMGADMIAVIPPPWIAREDDAAQCLAQVAGSVELPVMIHSSFSGSGQMVFSAGAVDRLVRGIFTDARRGRPQLSDDPPTLLPGEVPMLARALEPLRKYFSTCPPDLPPGPPAEHASA